MIVLGVLAGAACSSSSDSSKSPDVTPSVAEVGTAAAPSTTPSPATSTTAPADRHETAFEFYASAETNGPTSVCTTDGKGCVQIPNAPGVRTDLVGDWSGEVVDATTFTGGPVADPAGFYQYQAAGLRAFAGTIEPCGTGGLTLGGEDENLVALDGSPGTPTRNGRWWIVPGSGWGDLEGVSGGGSIELDIAAGALGSTVRFTGFVDCNGVEPSPVPSAEAAGTDELFAFTVPLAATETRACLTGTQRCARLATISVDELSGRWAGQLITAAGRYKILGDPERELQEGVTVVSGSAGECGVGTLAMRHYTDFASRAVSLSNGEELVDDGYWEVIPGYGTGALTTATGIGTWSASVVDQALSVRVLGALDCGTPPFESIATLGTCPDAAPPSFECWTVPAPVDHDDPTGATFELAVTVDRTTPGVWTSPVLRQSDAWSLNWKLPPPSRLVGHDSIFIDVRGFGRSAPLPECPGIPERFGNWNSSHEDAETSRLLEACVADAMTAVVPLDQIADLDNVAADFSVVRRALGIDRWGLAAARSGLDPMLRLIALEAGAVTGLLASSPQVAGIGRSIDTAFGAAGRFAEDCAAVPSCATYGDLWELLDQALTRLGDGVATNVLDDNGEPLVLDASAILGAIELGLGDASIAPLVPGLLAGIANGTGDDAVAGYFARRIPVTALTHLLNCQDRSFQRADLSTIGDPDADNPFARSTRATWCEAAGPIPQVTPAPSVSSSVPVLAVVPSYDTNSSEENTMKIFAGFSNTTVVFAPWVSDAGAQLPDCYPAFRSAFFDDPSKPVDASCITDPANPILQ